MRKIIKEGETMPWYYGFAYRLWDRCAYVAYPFPINHLVSFTRTLWFSMRDATFSKKEQRAYSSISLEQMKIDEQWRVLRKIHKEQQEKELQEIAEIWKARTGKSLPTVQ